MKLNCVVIDDEPVAIQGLKEYLKKIDFVQLANSFTSPLFPEVNQALEAADILFLDIQMPELTGIEFLRSIPNPPMTIFTTAYSTYALESYDLDVIDYLVKPVAFERFLKAVTKARDFYLLKAQAKVPAVNYFFAKVNNQQEKIYYSDILYIEAMEHFVTIYTVQKKMVTYMALGSMEATLPQENFMRIHKSFIVALDKVQRFTSEKVQIQDAQIPISRNLKKELSDKLLFLKK